MNINSFNDNLATGGNLTGAILLCHDIFHVSHRVIFCVFSNYSNSIRKPLN